MEYKELENACYDFASNFSKLINDTVKSLSVAWKKWFDSLSEEEKMILQYECEIVEKEEKIRELKLKLEKAK